MTEQIFKGMFANMGQAMGGALRKLKITDKRYKRIADEEAAQAGQRRGVEAPEALAQRENETASSSSTRSTRSPRAAKCRARTCRARACSATCCRWSRALTVNTKYGMVKTDHILFIASGAFHLAKPSDLIPELQGRFPIRVELGALSVADFEAILTQTQASLLTQYRALLATEGVTLEVTPDGIRRLAEIAFEVNDRTENIGARRLSTVMERLLDEVSFDAPNLSGTTVTVDAAAVDERLGELVKNEDLSRYIL